MIYTNRSINIISIVITCIIFCLVSFVVNFTNRKQQENFFTILKEKYDVTIDKEIKEEVNIDLGSWYIEIPSINLKAPISEGTSMEILNTYVGHFEETSLENGNIGLAAHNRGYEKNYFKDLKSVKIDDEINYNYEGFQKKYKVDKIEIIENTDWSYLESTDENKITLITCVENEPNFRRCVQATQI